MCLSSYWEEDNLLFPHTPNSLSESRAATWTLRDKKPCTFLFCTHACQSRRRTATREQGGGKRSQISNFKPGLLDLFIFFHTRQFIRCKGGSTCPFINLVHKKNLIKYCTTLRPTMGHTDVMDYCDGVVWIKTVNMSGNAQCSDWLVG